MTPADQHALREALARAEAERDEAREERDALLRAAGFNPGPFRTDLSRKVITEDIAGMRPAMVKARRAAERVQGDADLWTMRMLEEWPGDTLLIRLWRQRREAVTSLRAAEAENTRLKETVEAARAALMPFAEEAAIYDPDDGDGGAILWAGIRLRIKHLRAARSVLATIPPKESPDA